MIDNGFGDTFSDSASDTGDEPDGGGTDGLPEGHALRATVTDACDQRVEVVSTDGFR